MLCTPGGPLLTLTLLQDPTYSTWFPDRDQQVNELSLTHSRRGRCRTASGLWV